MNNKLFLALSFFLVGSSLAACGGSDDIDAKTIEQVKTFAASMKKGVNDFNGLIYESSFKEKYKVAYESEGDAETENYTLDYHGEGDVFSGYALNVNNQADVTPTLIYNQGTGFFSGRQQETAKLSHVVTSKSNQTKAKNTQADYALSHEFGIQFDGNELYALGKSTLTNNLVAANSESGEFYGKIAKSALNQFGELAIETTISRILYLEAWSNISLFKEATIQYFADLDLSTDDKVKQFVNDKRVKVTETDESIKVNFVLDGGKILDGLTNKETGITANVAGTAQISKQTKFVTYSDYDFKDLFLALFQKGNTGKKSYSVSVDACTLATVLTSFSASEKKLEGTFTEYTDAQRAEFMTNFKNYVIPSVDNVEIEG